MTKTRFRRAPQHGTCLVEHVLHEYNQSRTSEIVAGKSIRVTPVDYHRLMDGAVSKREALRVYRTIREVFDLLDPLVRVRVKFDRNSTHRGAITVTFTFRNVNVY